MNQSADGVFTIVDEYDDVKDFLDEVEEKHVEVEEALLRLESTPDDTELLNQVFRALHTVKGDAKIFHIEPMVEFTHSVESLVEALREGEFTYCKRISEIILLSIDRLLAIARDVATVGYTQIGDLGDVKASVDLLVKEGAKKLEKNAPIVIEKLTGKKPDPEDVAKVEQEFKDLAAQEVKEKEVKEKEKPKDVEKSKHVEKPKESEKAKTESSATPVEESNDQAGLKPDSVFSLPETLDPDLKFFRSLGEEVDKGQVRWDGRTAFLAAIALGMNGAAGKPVDYFQLEAAVYLHDIGMGFVPDSIINKQGKLSLEELSELRVHPEIAGGILQRMMGWDPAVEMMLQHHERFDGKGYPNKLKGDEICHGGRIIAICDAFYAMTHQRPDRVSKKSILRAVTEINACAKTQFCPFWVEQFNTVIKIQHAAGSFKGFD